MQLLTKSLLLVLILASLSCNNEVSCDDLSTHLIGFWAAPETINNDLFEFRQDSVFSDPDQVLLGSILNGVPLTTKKWWLESDTLLRLQGISESGTQVLNSKYSIVSYECKSVVLEVFGVSLTIQKL